MKVVHILGNSVFNRLFELMGYVIARGFLFSETIKQKKDQDIFLSILFKLFDKLVEPRKKKALPAGGEWSKRSQGKGEVTNCNYKVRECYRCTQLRIEAIIHMYTHTHMYV